MSKFDEILYSRQAQRITDLMKLNEQLNIKIHTLENENNRLKRAANYYDILQSLVKENIILQNDWDRFCTLIKLSCDKDDLEELS